VSALVEAAADYECKLLVFPEYFSIQLLTLGNLRRPVREQVRDLASQAPRVVELFSGLAARHTLSVLGGTIPVQDEPGAPVHNEAFFFNPQGRHATPGKLHMTRFETEDWRVTARQRLKIFDTALGKIGVTICYDVAFPEIARAAAPTTGRASCACATAPTPAPSGTRSSEAPPQTVAAPPR